MRRVLPTVVIGALAITVAGCQSNSPEESTESGEAGGPLSVVSTDDQCEVSTTEAPSGRIAFSVKNEGSQVTEFYLLGTTGCGSSARWRTSGPG